MHRQVRPGDAVRRGAAAGEPPSHPPRAFRARACRRAGVVWEAFGLVYLPTPPSFLFSLWGQGLTKFEGQSHVGVSLRGNPASRANPVVDFEGNPEKAPRLGATFLRENPCPPRCAVVTLFLLAAVACGRSDLVAPDESRLTRSARYWAVQA